MVKWIVIVKSTVRDRPTCTVVASRACARCGSSRSFPRWGWTSAAGPPCPGPSPPSSAPSRRASSPGCSPSPGGGAPLHLISTSRRFGSGRLRLDGSGCSKLIFTHLQMGAALQKKAALIQPKGFRRVLLFPSEHWDLVVQNDVGHGIWNRHMKSNLFVFAKSKFLFLLSAFCNPVLRYSCAKSIISHYCHILTSTSSGQLACKLFSLPYSPLLPHHGYFLFITQYENSQFGSLLYVVLMKINATTPTNYYLVQVTMNQTQVTHSCNLMQLRYNTAHKCGREHPHSRSC